MDDNLAIRPGETMQEHADRLLADFRGRKPATERLIQEWTDELAGLAIRAYVMRDATLAEHQPLAEHQRLAELRTILAS